MTKLKIATWMTTIILILTATSVVLGQAVNNAQIHGLVQDPSGAVIPGAQVVATSTDTGATHSTVSGHDGTFVLADLQVGGYALEVTASGFTKYKQTGIVLQVGQNVEVNVSLKVGAANQEVQVSADAAMVETQDTSISEVMD